VRRRITVFGGLAGLIALGTFGLVSVLSGTPSRPVAVTRTTVVTPHRAPHHVVGLASRSFTFIDPGRSTFDYTTGKRIDRRSLGVEFLYLTKAGVADRITPDAPIERRMAYPLVLFAPGYRLRTANYTTLLEAWVRAGFLVASISFPDTTYPASDVPYSAHLPYGLPEGDLYNQPGDVAFLLGKLNASAQGGAWYDGLVDPHRIVLAGHSDGGSTVAALVYDSAAPHTSVAVRGVVVLSGSEFPISGQTYAQPSSGEVPLLVVQGTADRCSPPAGAIGLYDAIGAPKDLDLLTGASHLGPYDGSEPTSFGVVQRLTTRFLEDAVGASSVTSTSLATAGNAPGVAVLSSNAHVLEIPAPPGGTVCPAD
jgi:hypothetical protein